VKSTRSNFDFYVVPAEGNCKRVDHSGHVTVELSTTFGSSFFTDGGGLATQHLQYTRTELVECVPFGEDFGWSLSPFEGHQQNTAAYYTPYTFSGKERDMETGLSYFGARYYDAGLSIWLSVDPMSDKQPALSSYHYCAWNPIILKDPDGRHPILIGAFIGGAIEAGSQVVSNIVQGRAPLRDLDYADIGVAMAEGAYMGSGAGIVGKIVSTAGSAFLRASVDGKSTGLSTIFPGIGREKNKLSFGQELGAVLIGGAFGKLFDSNFGQMLLDGLNDGGLKEMRILLELKKGIDLNEVIVKPGSEGQDVLNEVLKENPKLQERHEMSPCIGCGVKPDAQLPSQLETELEL
jgi:RHS repeat-associated protein